MTDIEGLLDELDVRAKHGGSSLFTPGEQAAIIREVVAERDHLLAIINEPCNDDFLKGVSIEKEHQQQRWGAAHDRSKSAENWFWLVGYLAGKCLRCCISGDREKAMHHTISSAAALANWHDAIKADTTGAGIGQDKDLRPTCCEEGRRLQVEVCSACAKAYGRIPA